MKQFLLKMLVKKTEEADLTKEAANATAYYVKHEGQGLPMLEKQRMMNYVAHGFFMGWREKEKRLKGEE